MDRRVGVERIAAEFRDVLRPLMGDRDQRKARLFRAFSGHHGLTDQISVDGDTSTFLSSLFKKLHEYGEIEVGKFAVCVILESIRGEVGLKDRERIKEILHVYPRSRLGESFETRGRMLKKVRKIWITGFLEWSLSHETRILLGLNVCPNAVARPMDLLVQRPDQGERPLPPGTPVVKVFDDNEQLLILGAPGSGKTTLLLELARDLLARAEDNPTHPIPVVFPLSTWAESRRPLAEWLVEELNQRYDVSRKLAQAWVKNDQILPLLDGLDEVKQEHRVACVVAINAFRKAHDLPLVICSRTADYQALAEPLQLYGAIVVQPLSPQLVDSYLTEVGPAGATVRRAIDHDPTLGKMLDSPLLLNIVTVAYAGQPESQPRLSGTLEERRDHLFGAYVDQMFRRRGVARHYTPQQTIHWLAWLARQMVLRSQTVFYIERLQPDWLPGDHQRRVFRLASGLALWLALELACGLVGGLVSGLALGLVGLALGLADGLADGLDGLVSGLVIGLVFGLYSGLCLGLVVGLVRGLAGLLEKDITIACAETVSWSWTKLLSRSDLFDGLVYGLFFGLVIGLVVGRVGGLADGLAFGLRGMLFVVLTDWLCIFGSRGGLGDLLLQGLSVGYIETKNVPNQGIHRSAWNALRFGLVFGLAGWLVFGLVSELLGLVVRLSGWLVFGPAFRPASGPASRLTFGLGIWLIVGSAVGLEAGGRACLKHLVLRLMLVRNGSIPWNYVKFLDYAAERILLRKVGGGYIFIHRMLMEYFAAQYDESAVEATPNAEQFQVERERPEPAC